MEPESKDVTGRGAGVAPCASTIQMFCTPARSHVKAMRRASGDHAAEPGYLMSSRPSMVSRPPGDEAGAADFCGPPQPRVQPQARTARRMRQRPVMLAPFNTKGKGQRVPLAPGNAQADA